LLRNPIRGGQGPYWAVQPYDDDDDDDDFICGVFDDAIGSSDYKAPNYRIDK
jgi:hypothetical protein